MSEILNFISKNQGLSFIFFVIIAVILCTLFVQAYKAWERYLEYKERTSRYKE